MARIAQRSRSLIFGVAFLGVMAATGGLIGAIGGVVLVLLARTVLGMADALLLFMPASVGMGMVTAMLVGVMLMVRQSPAVARPAQTTPVAPQEAQQAA